MLNLFGGSSVMVMERYQLRLRVEMSEYCDVTLSLLLAPFISLSQEVAALLLLFAFLPFRVWTSASKTTYYEGDSHRALSFTGFDV